MTIGNRQLAISKRAKRKMMAKRLKGKRRKREKEGRMICK